MKQRAAKGEGEAQFSQGWLLLYEAGLLGASGTSNKVDVGLALSTAQFPFARYCLVCEYVSSSK